MARSQGSLAYDRFQLYQRYDEMCRDYADPLEFLFKVVAGKVRGVTISDKVTAAKELVGYRHAKLRSIDHNLALPGDDGPMQISWLESNELSGDEGELIESDNYSLPAASVPVTNS